MNEKARTAIDALNEMFWAQSVTFREEYRRNYYALLEYIMDADRADKSRAAYDEIRQRLHEQDRLEKITSVK